MEKKTFVFLRSVLILIPVINLAQSDVVVQVQEGVLKGTVLTTAHTNRTFFAFLGIPYAKPPVGDLRFKATQPPEAWPGTRDAVNEGAFCPQKDSYSYVFEGDEDCLFLNVYTPILPAGPEHPMKAVMVWIHGGGWHFGSGDRNNNGPQYLMEEDLVVVVINYRLGALGFLSLPEVGLHGNNGLKDQVMALRWIQQNIAQFGGDPHRVTIFGASAGGASVHYHLLSPMSLGLFKQAIIQSGTGLSYWAFNDREINRNYSFALGALLGHNTTDPRLLYEALRAESPERIINASFELVDQGNSIPFHPIEDTTADAGEVFLPGTPRDLIQLGRVQTVSVMAGVNSKEGIWELTNIQNATVRNNVRMEDIPNELGIKLDVNKTREVAEEIRRLYFGNFSVQEGTLDQHIDLSGDLLSVIGVYIVAKNQAKISANPVYLYQFSYSGGMNVFKELVGGSNITGSCHFDDTAYLFRLNRVTQKFSENSTEIMTSKRIVKLWTNYARSGNPTPAPDPLLQNVVWTPVNISDVTYLNIDNDLSLRHHFKKNVMEFWENLYQQNS